MPWLNGRFAPPIGLSRRRHSPRVTGDRNAQRQPPARAHLHLVLPRTSSAQGWRTHPSRPEFLRGRRCATAAWRPPLGSRGPWRWRCHARRSGRLDLRGARRRPRRGRRRRGVASRGLRRTPAPRGRPARAAPTRRLWPAAPLAGALAGRTRLRHHAGGARAGVSGSSSAADRSLCASARRLRRARRHRSQPVGGHRRRRRPRQRKRGHHERGGDHEERAQRSTLRATRGLRRRGRARLAQTARQRRHGTSGRGTTKWSHTSSEAPAEQDSPP